MVIHEKRRIIDELPQAAAGKTVMTTEPKFIPKNAVEISPANNVSAKFRLIDCVGYIAEGVQGIYEDEKERQVKNITIDEYFLELSLRDISYGRNNKKVTTTVIIKYKIILFILIFPF